MNREQLAKLIFDALKESDYVPDLVNALWPVLAQVWDEAHSIGYNDVEITTPNPYREVPE
jgi:hypothetical protein